MFTFQYGLYSAFMGCFVYCIFGSSKDISLGPTAIMSLMTAIFARAPEQDQGDPTYAIALTLMCGVIQFALGIFQLGTIMDLLLIVDSLWKWRVKPNVWDHPQIGSYGNMNPNVSMKGGKNSFSKLIFIHTGLSHLSSTRLCLAILHINHRLLRPPFH